MKDMKFMLVQALCGAFVGWAIAIILAAIAIPNFSNLFAPLEMIREFEPLGRLAQFIHGFQWLWLALVLLAVCLSWVLTARRLNPALPKFPFRTASLPGIVWTSFILSGFCILGGFFVLLNGIQVMTEHSPYEAMKLPVLALGLFLIVLGWFFISPEGCSGSFGERSRRLMPRVLGVLVFLALIFGTLFTALFILGKFVQSNSLLALLSALFCAISAFPIYWISVRVKRFLDRRWENAIVDTSESPPQYIRTAALGLLFGVTLALGIFVCQRLWMFLFTLNVEVWTDSPNIEFGGMLRIMGILIFVCAALFSVGFGLAQAFSADGSSVKERLRRAVPAAFLAAVLAIPIGFLYLNAILKHDWRSGGLAKAAGLSKETPEPMTVITLGLSLGKKSVELTPWPMTARAYSFFSSGEVSATEENAKWLEAFLKEKKESRYRSAAFEAFPNIYGVLWENEKGMQAQDRFMFSEEFSRELPVLWYALRLSSLAHHSSLTKENKERLLRFSDSSRFHIPGSRALFLAKGWRRFGDFPRARFWFEEVKRLGADSQAIQESGSLSEKPLTSGVIRGKIRIQKASPAARIKVGLFSRVVPLRATDSIYPPYHGGLLSPLVESQWARPDGSFLFKNLSSEGGYYICLLVPSSLIAVDELSRREKQKKVRVVRHPGFIRLSKSSPVKDLGAIALHLSKGD